MTAAPSPITKLLVANRSEIAIRCCRAATELGLRTVGIYSYEDRYSLHRFKADEAYLVGPPDGGAPVRAYLDIEQIVAVARRCGADAVHPGYGFLAESAPFARACEAAGLRFVGPTVAQLETFGDKTAARRLAQSVGVPTVPGSETALSTDHAVQADAARIGYPLMVKASFGGGGRGMRVVREAGELLAKVGEARREAAAAFGHDEVFLERLIRRAKHIEVQVVGDAHGNLVHLWERDCSVQRRHQKVVEIAPSALRDADLRRRICAAALRICAAVGYRAAGTVEFLLDADSGEFYFIEVNPRIQVEHTVTEAVTGIDIVRSQLLVAAGHALHGPEIAMPPQEAIVTRGFAVQCRVTTENPENRFIPDYGRLTTYREPGGFGVRIDSGNGFSGAVITPYFDSLLVKLTTWGATLDEATGRADRSLREFRIRGVSTNIGFVLNVLAHPAFRSGQATTTFIDDTPELYRIPKPGDRATRLLQYLGDVIVNGRPEVKGAAARPLALPAPPAVRMGAAPPPGTRQRLQAMGPERFAQWVRDQQPVLVTDTTFRDAHQSLLATRMRTFDLLRAAEPVAHMMPGLFSLEMWGGATFDTAYRFLQEDPWERLRKLRALVPNILFQMLLRGSNAVGYSTYPDNVVREFIRVSAAEGIDVFRVFDSLNAVDNMQVAMDAIREDTSAVCEAALCYTGDILDPARTKFGIDYYLRLARELVRRGAHVLAIKDMAGLCRPFAAAALVKALRDEVGVPIHFHTHDTGGTAAASVLEAVNAGVDVVDAALSSMSGLTSQPPLNSIVAALQHTPRDPGFALEPLERLSEYWAAVRDLYFPFEEGLRSPSSDVYQHEMPGGQLTNLRQQARAVGIEHRWNEICVAYAAANRLCGDIVKVTPSSKVIGDLALFMVVNDLSADDVLAKGARLDFPKSVVDMMQGRLGVPDGGWPMEFQRAVLHSAGVQAIDGRAGASMPAVDFAETRRTLEATAGRPVDETEVLSYLLYPSVFLDYLKHQERFGDTSVLATPQFFWGLDAGQEVDVAIEPGKTLIIRYLTDSPAAEDGSRVLFFELNGQLREAAVADRGAAVTSPKRQKANPDDGNHVGAPMPGKIASLLVSPGQKVSRGDRLLSLEAMKMETAVSSPRDGTIAEIPVSQGMTVNAGDLLVVLA